MSFFVKYYNNFRFNKLAKFSYLILYLIKHPHTHTHTEILHYNYILLISIWKLCKNDFEHLPSCKDFLQFKNLSEGINKAEYGRNMPKETKNRSR